MAPPHESWTSASQLDSFDSTLANLGEVVFACLDAARARTVVEVGAEYGFFTQRLLEWGRERGAERIAAVDPAPRPSLQELADSDPDLELIVATSHEALAEIELPDAVILDGDHNYFTVAEELRLIAERAPGRLPLLLLHDVGWPLGRRDSFHVPERIPDEHRPELARAALLAPGNEGVAARGLYYEWAAAHEGGPRNGVLTAVEDFLADRPQLRLALVAPFFGLGVVWDETAEWAGELATALEPWDRNPVLERVEEKRVAHLVAEFENLQEIDALHSAEYELRFGVIGRLLPIRESSAFALAERLSRLRQGGDPNVSRAGIDELISDLARDDVRVDLMRPGSGG